MVIAEINAAPRHHDRRLRVSPRSRYQGMSTAPQNGPFKTKGRLRGRSGAVRSCRDPSNNSDSVPPNRFHLGPRKLLGQRNRWLNNPSSQMRVRTWFVKPESRRRPGIHAGQSTARQFGINSCLSDKDPVFSRLLKNISSRFLHYFLSCETKVHLSAYSRTLLAGVLAPGP